MSQQVAQVLQKARKRLIERGWRQGAYGDRDGPNCLAGAIDHSTASTKLQCASRVAIGRIVRSAVIRWNDKRGRKKSEVLSLLTRAINAEKKTA